jgi:hypothetical protein
MSVPITISPETGPPHRRSNVRRWLTATVAGAVIAAAGIAIATGAQQDSGRTPNGNPPSTERTVPSYPRDWTFNDPHVEKGAGGAPIR